MKNLLTNGLLQVLLSVTVIFLLSFYLFKLACKSCLKKIAAKNIFHSIQSIYAKTRYYLMV